MSLYHITLPSQDLNLPAQVGILSLVGAATGGLVSASASGMFVGGVFTLVTVLSLECMQRYLVNCHNRARSHAAHAIYVIASIILGMVAAGFAAPLAGYAIAADEVVAISAVAFGAIYLAGLKIIPWIVQESRSWHLH